MTKMTEEQWLKEFRKHNHAINNLLQPLYTVFSAMKMKDDYDPNGNFAEVTINGLTVTFTNKQVDELQSEITRFKEIRK